MNSTSSIVDAAKAVRRKQIALEARADDADAALSALLRGFDYATGGERAYRQLLLAPYRHFEEWDGDTGRQYQKGDVVRTGEWKWLLQNNGNISPNPAGSGLTKLFRSTDSHEEDGAPREWEREEFCIFGMERLYNGAWYRVKAPVVDSATPPPNDAASWEATGQ